MDGAEIRKVSEEALEQLATALEQGKSETLKRYLAVMARFTHYSLGNQMLIARQKPEATRVAGYRTGRPLGRQVRRGERAIRILAPIVRWGKDEEDEEETLVVRGDETWVHIIRESGEMPSLTICPGSPFTG